MIAEPCNACISSISIIKIVCLCCLYVLVNRVCRNSVPQLVGFELSVL